MGNLDKVCRAAWQRRYQSTGIVVIGRAAVALLIVMSPCLVSAEEVAGRLKKLDDEVDAYSQNDKHALAVRPMSIAYLLDRDPDRLWNLAVLYRKIFHPAIAIELYKQYLAVKSCTQLVDDPNANAVEKGECNQGFNRVVELGKEFQPDESKARVYAKMSISDTLFDEALSWNIREKHSEAWSAYQQFLNSSCPRDKPDPLLASECEDAHRFSERLVALMPSLAVQRSGDLSARPVQVPKVEGSPKRAQVIALASSSVAAPEETGYVASLERENRSDEELQLQEIRKLRREAESQLADLERQKQAAQQEAQRARAQSARERAALEHENRAAARDSDAAERQRKVDEEEKNRRDPNRVGRGARISGIVMMSVGIAGTLGGALLASGGLLQPSTGGSQTTAPLTPEQERTQLLGWSVAGGGAGVAIVGGMVWYIGRSMQRAAIAKAHRQPSPALPSIPFMPQLD